MERFVYLRAVWDGQPTSSPLKPRVAYASAPRCGALHWIKSAAFGACEAEKQASANLTSFWNAANDYAHFRRSACRCGRSFRSSVPTQLRLHQRKQACQLQIDQHLNAPVDLKEQRRAFGR